MCPIYDTRTVQPKVVPDLTKVDEIVFTSPSTVKAFLDVFSEIPQDKKLTTIGPVTEQALYGVLYGNEI